MDLHPNISIDLTLTERVVDLIEDRVDLAFRTGAFKPSSRLVASKIGEAQTMLCASPDYLEKYGTPSSHLDFKNHKCLCYARNPKWRLQKDGRWYEYMPNGHIVTNSGETIREFCIRGQGIAFMSSMLAEFAVKKGRLVQIMPDYTCEKMPVNAIRVGDHRSTTRVIKLLEFVVAELQSRHRDIAEFI